MDQRFEPLAFFLGQRQRTFRSPCTHLRSPCILDEVLWYLVYLFLGQETSKAGLLGILHTAANELGPYQIRVNAVCPGVIRTRLAELHFSSNPGVLKDYFRHVPLGRAGLPEE